MRNTKGQFIKGNTFHHSEATKRKIAVSHIGVGKGIPLAETHKRAIAEGMKGKHSNEENPAWKGEKVKYMGLHNWVRRHLGTPKKCMHCGTTEEKVYHWANISKKYKRDLNDWVRLCVPCHRKFDKKA